MILADSKVVWLIDMYIGILICILGDPFVKPINMFNSEIIENIFCHERTIIQICLSTKSGRDGIELIWGCRHKKAKDPITQS